MNQYRSIGDYARLTNIADALILNPEERWFKYQPDMSVNFPKLHYYQCSKLNVPESLRMGGSYSYYCDCPFYYERCAMFSHLYMPYQLNTENFKVREGFLLWPRINLKAYTDLLDPRSVYIKKQFLNSGEDDKFVAVFRFCDSYIEICELVDDYTE